MTKDTWKMKVLFRLAVVMAVVSLATALGCAYSLLHSEKATDAFLVVWNTANLLILTKQSFQIRRLLQEENE